MRADARVGHHSAHDPNARQGGPRCQGWHPSRWCLCGTTTQPSGLVPRGGCEKIEGKLRAPTPQIKVIHVMNALAVAGMEVGVVKLVNRLDPRLFSSLICCIALATEDARALVDPRVRVIVLGRKPGIDPSIALKLVHIFRRERPDVVHSHNWGTFLYSVVAARLARVPVLIHGEHGYED